jgi:hypothetical protein
MSGRLLVFPAVEFITQNGTEGFQITNNFTIMSAFHAGNPGSNPGGDANLQNPKSLQ